MSPPGGAVDLQRGPRGPVDGRPTEEEDGLRRDRRGRGAAGCFEADGGEEEAAVEGRGVHG